VTKHGQKISTEWTSVNSNGTTVSYILGLDVPDGQRLTDYYMITIQVCSDACKGHQYHEELPERLPKHQYGRQRRSARHHGALGRLHLQDAHQRVSGSAGSLSMCMSVTMLIVELHLLTRQVCFSLYQPHNDTILSKTWK
jgi:hypothetical protein